MGSTFLVSNFVCFSIGDGVGANLPSILFVSNSGFFTTGATGVGGIVGNAAISFFVGSTFVVSNSGFFSIGSTVEGGCSDNNSLLVGLSLLVSICSSAGSLRGVGIIISSRTSIISSSRIGGVGLSLCNSLPVIILVVS